MKRPLRAHIVALIASFVTILAVSALWIVNLRMGPELDGFTGGAMVVFVPFAHPDRDGCLSAGPRIAPPPHTVAGGDRGDYVDRFRAVRRSSSIAVRSPVSRPDENRLMGWFIIAGVALAALVHHVVLDRFPAEAAHAAHRA